MIHISSATTVQEMWNQLTTVKELKGQLGVLATRRVLYRTMVEEGFEMVTHISNLRQLQEELHILGSFINKDFVMILLTSLPESWDNYMMSLFGLSGNKPSIKSHELVVVLLKEDCRQKAHGGESSETALHAKSRGKFGNDNPNKDKKCFNCKKKGHIKEDCWMKVLIYYATDAYFFHHFFMFDYLCHVVMLLISWKLSYRSTSVCYHPLRCKSLRYFSRIVLY